MHESNAVFTKDGKTVYFTRNNYLDGRGFDASKVTLLKIYKATVDKEGQWNNITALPFNSDSYQTGHPALSPDEKTLYFVSDMPGTHGQSDIFRVKLNDDGSFGNTENLGDDITVFHDITVYEQITSYWDITYNMSIVQVENFDVPIPFRPVIQNASNAISYNIDYVIRIYNEKDNTQIVKRASYTSFETGKYGKKLARINLPSSNKILKVYNTMPNILENRQITQNLATLPNNQTRFVPTFIERMNIVTGSTSVTVSQNEVVDNSTITYYSDGNSQLTLSPFDNYIKFKVAKQDGNDLISISLEGADKVVLDLAGVSIDNNMNYDDVDLSDGEIMFKISQENAQKAKNAIANSSDNVYMLSIQNGSDKTMIHHGKYTVLGASANTTVSAPIQATKQNITSAL